MGLRLTADNTLSYQLDRVPEPMPAMRRQRRSEPRCANVHAIRPAVDRSGTNGRQDSSAPTAKTGFVDSEPTPSRFPADRRGDQDVLRSHLCTNFLLAQAASRAALHVQIGSRNMTSVSSSNTTKLGYGVSALKPAEPTETTEHPLALLYLVQAARQLRPVTRPLRTTSAVASQ